MRAVASHSSRCRWAWRVRGGGLCQHSVPRLWRAPWRPAADSNTHRHSPRTAPALPNGQEDPSAGNTHQTSTEDRLPLPVLPQGTLRSVLLNPSTSPAPPVYICYRIMCACLCSGSVSNMLTAACLLTVASPAAAECVADLVRQKPNALTLSYPLTCITVQRVVMIEISNVIQS